METEKNVTPIFFKPGILYFTPRNIYWAALNNRAAASATTAEARRVYNTESSMSKCHSKYITVLGKKQRFSERPWATRAYLPFTHLDMQAVSPLQCLAQRANLALCPTLVCFRFVCFFFLNLAAMCLPWRWVFKSYIFSAFFPRRLRLYPRPHARSCFR